MQTRPECKRNVVWPTEGELLYNLQTTRFTQFAGLTQPTSIENVGNLFVVGIQGPVPSNADNSWPENLLGHDLYEDFGSTLGNYNLTSWGSPNITQNSGGFLIWYITYCDSAPTEIIYATGNTTIYWESTFTPGENPGNFPPLYANHNVEFTTQIFAVSNTTYTPLTAPIQTFYASGSFGTGYVNGQITVTGFGSFSFDFSTLPSNQTLVMRLKVFDTNTSPTGTCSPGGYMFLSASSPRLYENTDYPNPTIYYQSNNSIYTTNTFPPVGYPFIATVKIPQTFSSNGSNVPARFQGISYDSFNSNSGWTGDFGEMIVYKKNNLTDSQSNLVLLYLAEKWGFLLSDTNPPSVFPNVKPFPNFTPNDFDPIVWYDSSDSQVLTTLQVLGSLVNNSSNISCLSNLTTPTTRTPIFSVQDTTVAGKLKFSGLGGNPCIERTMNGLATLYIDSETSLLYDNDITFGSNVLITNIFFVGRQGQYSGQFSQWDPVLTYSSNGTDNVLYQGYIFTSQPVSNNINQVPDPNNTTTYWIPVTKYQSIFGNLGYNVATPNNTNLSQNPLLGGQVVSYLQSPITSSSTASNVTSQASDSTTQVNSTVFTTSNAYNSNLLLSTASQYSINQVGTTRYQVTSPASRFFKAVTVTGETVTFPQESSSFLVSINGIQANGFQDTTFKGLFYDDVSSKDGWQGDFAELITFTSNLTPQEILLVEGYLATKWGLQNALPPSHPFFYSANLNQVLTCLTGYSPITFGNVGAEVNSSNDQVTVSGSGLPTSPIIVTFIDGKYNGSTLATMIQTQFKDKLGSQYILVSYGNASTKLTFVNTYDSNLTLSTNLGASILLGLIDPSSTTPGTTTTVLGSNSYFNAPYSLGTIISVSVCAWDGDESCPTNFSEVLSDSNELALPYAKRCAKPFSSLLPQVQTNVGSNQVLSCPLGTELIATNQNADPAHPVCSYVCDPPYYDSGITCGYFPVYSPLDNQTVNILNDNSSANISNATSSSNLTLNAIQFMVVAVILSFIIGLAIKQLSSVSSNPPTESAAGSVLEQMIRKKTVPNKFISLKGKNLK